MKILILGGTGAMGTFLVKELAARGNEVFVTTRSARNKTKSKECNISYIQGNAHDDGFLKTLMIGEHWDAVVDFMVYSTDEFKRRYLFLLDNTEHYIFLSSARVYADSKEPITEESPRLLDVCRDAKYLTTDEYALAKARQEDLLRSSGYKNRTIVRQYRTYSADRLQLAVFEKENWLYPALQGRTIVFSKDIAEHYTTMTYGGDVAKGIAMLIGNNKAKAQTFHIAGPQSMKWKDILAIYLDTIEKWTGKSPNVLWIENMDKLEKFMGNHYQVHYDRFYNRMFDSGKLERVCGAEMQYTPIEDGLGMCLSRFINDEKHFMPIAWYVIAYMDKLTDEMTITVSALSMKQKLAYYTARYLPFNFSYSLFKLANAVKNNY